MQLGPEGEVRPEPEGGEEQGPEAAPLLEEEESMRALPPLPWSMASEEEAGCQDAC